MLKIEILGPFWKKSTFNCSFLGKKSEIFSIDGMWDVQLKNK